MIPYYQDDRIAVQVLHPTGYDCVGVSRQDAAVWMSSNGLEVGHVSQNDVVLDLRRNLICVDYFTRGQDCIDFSQNPPRCTIKGCVECEGSLTGDRFVTHRVEVPQRVRLKALDDTR